MRDGDQLESELLWKRDMRAHDGARRGLPRSVTGITKRKLKDRSAARNRARLLSGEMSVVVLEKQNGRAESRKFTEGPKK